MALKESLRRRPIRHESLTANALRTQKLSKWALRNRRWPRKFTALVEAVVREHPNDLKSAKEAADIAIREQLPSWNGQAIENAINELERRWYCFRSQPGFGAKYLSHRPR